VYFWSVLEGLERLGVLGEAEAAAVRKQDYTYLVRRAGERKAARRDVFVNRVSPVFHANGAGRELAEALAVLRRLATDPEFRWQRLIFTKSLEAPYFLGAP
jgi:hypothetical protein